MRRGIDENGQHYVIRQGKRIAVDPVEVPEPPSRKARKAFEPEWVKLPLRWIEVLRQSKRMATWQLAHVILLEAFKRQYTGGEIVLSSTMTRMPKNTRIRAIKELAELGLIKLHRSSGNQAYRVSVISTTKNKIE
jgi:hypothetical protein